MTARFALARIRAHVVFGRGGHAPEAHAGEVQVAPVGSDEHRVAAQGFDAIHAVLEDHFVRDLGTGLIWQRTVPDRTFAFDEAGAYCGQLSLAGQPGWRLPSMTELLTLIDEGAAAAPLIDATAFPNTPSEAFWTSSEFGGASGMAWQVYFDHGNGLYGLSSAQLSVRCLR